MSISNQIQQRYVSIDPESGLKDKDAQDVIRDADALEADVSIDPESIGVLNKVRKPDLFKKLVADFEADGWNGRPVLVYADDQQAYTGSHRILAAREAGIEVPVVLVTKQQMSVEVSDGFTLLDAMSGDDAMRSDAFVAAATKDPSLRKAAILMRAEYERDEL